MDKMFAIKFAQEWSAAWNAGELERIFFDYADDFEFSSRYIIVSVRVWEIRVT